MIELKKGIVLYYVKGILTPFQQSSELTGM